MKLMLDEHERELNTGVKKSTSECSSGCQSGWTMYLDHSSAPFSRELAMQQQDEDEDEDLSMVSDASSGPAHLDEEEHRYYCGNGCCFCSASSLLPSTNNIGSGKKRRVEAGQQHKTKQETNYSLLDDTASSPLFSFSKTSCKTTNTSNSKKKLYAKDVLEHSCDLSATQFKGKSAQGKHLGYFNSCAAMKPSSVSREDGDEKLW